MIFANLVLLQTKTRCWAAVSERVTGPPYSPNLPRLSHVPLLLKHRLSLMLCLQYFLDQVSVPNGWDSLLPFCDNLRGGYRSPLSPQSPPDFPMSHSNALRPRQHVPLGHLRCASCQCQQPNFWKHKLGDHGQTEPINALVVSSAVFGNRISISGNIIAVFGNIIAIFGNTNWLTIDILANWTT